MNILKKYAILSFIAASLSFSGGDVHAESGVSACSSILDLSAPNYLGVLMFVPADACSLGVLDADNQQTLAPEVNQDFGGVSGYTLCSFQTQSVSSSSEKMSTYVCQINHTDVSFSKNKTSFAFQTKTGSNSYSMTRWSYYMDGRESALYAQDLRDGKLTRTTKFYPGMYFNLPEVVIAPDGTQTYSSASTLMFKNEIDDYVAGFSDSVAVHLLFALIYH